MTRVRLQAIVEFETEFPAPYDNPEHILFRYNLGTWCGGNLVDEAMLSNGDCGCKAVKAVRIVSIGDTVYDPPLRCEEVDPS